MIEFAQRIVRVEESLERIEEKLDHYISQHERIIFGMNGSPGLLVEFDRLRQDATRRARIHTWVAGVMGALIVGLTIAQF